MVKTARIINTHALKGECKLYLYTDQPEKRFVPGALMKLKNGQSLKVKRFRMQKNLGYAFFEGIDSIEKAEALKNQDLYVEESALEDLEEDEYYYHQLMGLEVFNEEGEDLGQVSDILETGANLVLRVGQGDTSFLLPFISQVVLDVDVAKGRLKIHELEGLR